MCDAANPTDARKRFTTLQAKLAFSAWVLDEIRDADGVHYLASRWGRSRSLPDLDAVQRFLEQIGGQHHG
jgi:hypothetical protein